MTFESTGRRAKLSELDDRTFFRFEPDGPTYQLRNGIILDFDKRDLWKLNDTLSETEVTIYSRIVFIGPNGTWVDENPKPKFSFKTFIRQL